MRNAEKREDIQKDLFSVSKEILEWVSPHNSKKMPTAAPWILLLHTFPLKFGSKRCFRLLAAHILSLCLQEIVSPLFYKTSILLLGLNTSNWIFWLQINIFLQPGLDVEVHISLDSRSSAFVVQVRNENDNIVRPSFMYYFHSIYIF